MHIGNYELSAACKLMSILPQTFQHTWRSCFQRALDQLMPGICLLCGEAAAASLICTACHADLPGLPATRCPQCGDLTTHGERCGACMHTRPHFDRATALFRYDFPVDRIIHALKYGHQLAVARWLGEQMARQAGDCPATLIVPLPLHALRLRERGFNQSAEIARHISRLSDIDLDLRAVKRNRHTRPQAELALKARGGNVRGAFECTRDLSGQHILLVDDVMTSGATLNECARILKLHGAGSVTAAVAARALRH
jgi:ComF family protein